MSCFSIFKISSIHRSIDFHSFSYDVKVNWRTPYISLLDDEPTELRGAFYLLAVHCFGSLSVYSSSLFTATAGNCFLKRSKNPIYAVQLAGEHSGSQMFSSGVSRDKVRVQRERILDPHSSGCQKHESEWIPIVTVTQNADTLRQAGWKQKPSFNELLSNVNFQSPKKRKGSNKRQAMESPRERKIKRNTKLRTNQKTKR